MHRLGRAYAAKGADASIMLCHGLGSGGACSVSGTSAAVCRRARCIHPPPRPQCERRHPAAAAHGPRRCRLVAAAVPAGAADGSSNTTAAAAAAASAAAPSWCPSPVVLSSADLPMFLEGQRDLMAKMGTTAAASFDEWEIDELSGGVINSAWRAVARGRGADGGGGALLVKQALPYVRAVGPSFPLSTERMRIEAAAMSWAHSLAPDHVPELLLYDATNCVLAMPLLPPPHRPLVEALRDGEVFPALPAQLGALLSALFAGTSAAALGPERHAAAVADFANTDIVQANEQVVLIGPFTPDDPGNSWLPELEADVRGLWADTDAMEGAAEALQLYRSSSECLIHNDLHAGNLLVSPAGGMALIDFEFATFGPPSYDIGSLLASLAMAAVAAKLGGLPEKAPGARAEQFGALLAAVEEVWGHTMDGWWSKRQQQQQQRDVSSSSSSNSSSGGSGSSSRGAAGAAAGDRTAWEAETLSATAAFMGACMARLVVGMHSYAVFAELAASERILCERAALRVGRGLLAGQQRGVRSIRDVIALLREACN